MIDSVLKGSGNSRFLKSAVPAGTSWADALAMLQAGTFPIDFNGINTEGFQQVGTPLNKANLLKDATAAQIGLPPSTTPDGMFRALGNTGELHVWRKTVVNSQAKDAYYSLGSIIATSGTIIDLSKQNVNQVGFKLSDSVMVLPDGSVSLVDPKMYYKYTYNSNMYQHRFVASDGTYIIDGNFSGKFISFYADSPSYYGSNYITLDKIYYIPATASFTYGAQLTISQLQPVIGHAAITAGTTTTYPVSTNPNAWQEGDDAKAAGYVVGEVVTGQFKMGRAAASYPFLYYVSSALSVADDGTISIDGSTGTQIKMGYSESWTTDTWKTAIAGKFVQYKEQIGASSETSSPDTIPPFNTRGIIVFIPSDVEVSKSDGTYYIDRYQPVTGYPAIPAGTTIEYLGKLGDKARVQVVSYVGTGTYGSSNPNSLTFDFVPKMVIIRCNGDSSNKFDWIIGMTDVEVRWDGDYHCFVSIAGKTLSFYSFNSSYYQMNKSGKQYYAIAIG